MDQKERLDADFEAKLEAYRRRHISNRRREQEAATRETDGDHGNKLLKGAKDDHEQK